MNVIDTLQIPFPKTTEELAALDATREVPLLKALCNRRHIHVPGDNPSPAQIIPFIEQRLRDHDRSRPDPRFPNTDLAIEWKLIHDDLTELFTQLKRLCPPSQNSVLSVNSVLIPNSSTSPTPPKHPQTSGHFNKSNVPTPKSPAISTNPPQPSKTAGHFNHSPNKISSVPNPSILLQSEIPSPQSEILNLKSEIPRPAPSVVNNPATPAKRRNDPILSSLTPDQKQQLLHRYEQHPAIDASRLAAEKLNLQISPSTLSRLYATWRIQEDQDTINDLAAAYSDPSVIRASQSALASLTEQQLQLRLLELANRPNLDPAELRAICHSFARLQSLKLYDRRVQLAESKEARLARATPSDGPFSPEAYNQAINVVFGRDPALNDDGDFNSQENTEANECEASHNEPPDCAEQLEAIPETQPKVGRVAPRAPRTGEAL